MKIRKKILGLFIILGLGIIGTTQAGFIPHRIGMTANVGGYQMSVDQNINFYTNEIDNVLVQNRYEFVTLGRKNGHLYIYTNGYQGEIYQLYKCTQKVNAGEDPNRAEPISEGNCVYESEITIQKLKEIYQTATHWGLSNIVLDYKPGFCIGKFVNIGDEYYCTGPGIITGTNQNYTFTTSNSIQDIASNFTKAPTGGNETDIGTGTLGYNTGYTNYFCPTIQQLINTYSSDYNENLCYSSKKILTSQGMQTVEQKTIFELFPTYTGFQENINTYYNYCTPPATTQACQIAFTGNELGRSLINKIPESIRTANLYQYCHLQLDYPDKNATTCVTSGINQTGGNNIGQIQITNQDIINSILNDEYTVIPITSGTVLDQLIIDYGGETTTRNDIESIFGINILKTFTLLFSKITSIFLFRQDQPGIIPGYITSIILLIVLYKLFKK